ncbi:hypothetical protein EPD60_05875 [Flaviaesturariibacter flavus]|uniref:Transmembrane protein n=1 Tax=Flaviaesturariibacter flavus TaxID=2502780 RepID=A0A4R1BKH4_9BACT|nr:hypothetical protein EPD60_05875 [Flaviaesturariibacter flavus]
MWRNNGLTIVAFAFFLLTFVGQLFSGVLQYNEEQQQEGGAPVSLGKYLATGHFIEATFENWESEFLQMAMFVVLTAFLYQKGSAESKDPDKDEEVDHDDKPPGPDTPWPVKKGGWILKFYENSLSIVLFLLFLLSFVLHWYGSLKSFNQEQARLGKPLESAFQFLGNSKLWFESFQNWQSEFLSVGVMILFTIFLRQKGSAQSKPVEAPDSQTG